MFNYTCSLCGCQDEWCYSLCSNCLEVKKIVDLYSIQKVVNTLKDIYVRETTPIDKRTNAIITRSKKCVNLEPKVL